MNSKAHRFSVRIYYEDTDFSGRVYHASYLRFFERGRTEWLRALGFQHNELAQAGLAFAVVKLEIEFKAAASIDDLLEVATEVRELSGAKLRFQQTIGRGLTTLVVGVVDVVAIKGDRAVRPPRVLIEAFTNLKRR